VYADRADSSLAESFHLARIRRRSIVRVVSSEFQEEIYVLTWIRKPVKKFRWLVAEIMTAAACESLVGAGLFLSLFLSLQGVSRGLWYLN